MQVSRQGTHGVTVYKWPVEKLNMNWLCVTFDKVSWENIARFIA